MLELWTFQYMQFLNTVFRFQFRLVLHTQLPFAYRPSSWSRMEYVWDYFKVLILFLKVYSANDLRLFIVNLGVRSFNLFQTFYIL